MATGACSRCADHREGAALPQPLRSAGAQVNLQYCSACGAAGPPPRRPRVLIDSLGCMTGDARFTNPSIHGPCVLQSGTAKINPEWLELHKSCSFCAILKQFQINGRINRTLSENKKIGGPFAPLQLCKIQKKKKKQMKGKQKNFESSTIPLRTPVSNSRRIRIS